MAVLFVLQKAFDIGCQRNAHASAVYDQDHWRVRSVCQIISACSGGDSAHTVVEAHDAFHHCNITVCCVSTQKISGCIPICKKSVQIS